VISDDDGQTEIKSNEDVCFDAFSASDLGRSKAEVFADADRRLDLRTIVVGLIKLFLPDMNGVIVFFDPFLNAVLDVWWIVRIPGIVRGDWHDTCLNQIVVPRKHVKLGITDERYRLLDGERILHDAPRRLLVH
jgi:hypothetical protein